MSLRIIETTQAAAEVMSNALHIAADAGLPVGHKFLAAVHAAYEKLAEFPGLGVNRDYGSANLSGMRMWPVPGFRNHLIFYRASDSKLQIVHVLHGAQDLQHIFDQE